MQTGIYAPIAPDSEDAYAATILSLAFRYRLEAHDNARGGKQAFLRFPPSA
jgi:hypothetical protein